MNYYDIAKADAFERLFEELAIDRQPTPLHNQYLVMKWDFSNIESHGAIREIRATRYNHSNAHIKNFQLTYGTRLAHPIEVHPDDVQLSANFAKKVWRCAETMHLGGGRDWRGTLSMGRSSQSSVTNYSSIQHN
jgi:hypothetical protein